MLRSITFSIDVDEPDLSPRRIMFEIYDGEQWSDPAYATVTIEPINDHPPEIDLAPQGEVRRYCYLSLSNSHNVQQGQD